MFPEDFSDPLKFIGKSYTASQRALIFSIVDETLYGHWVFPLSTCLYLPLWSIAWTNLSNCSWWNLIWLYSTTAYSMFITYVNRVGYDLA